MHASALATLLVPFPFVLLNACTQMGDTRSAAAGETRASADNSTVSGRPPASR